MVLAKSLISRPEVFAEVTSLIDQTRQNFLETTLCHTIPALVLDGDRDTLETIASILKRSLALIVVDNAALILSRLFLHPKDPGSSLGFLVETVLRATRHQSTAPVSATSLITSCIVPFVVTIIIELGNEDNRASKQANKALLRAQRTLDGDACEPDLGRFLKPHMLGVMTHLNETLHDIRGKKSAVFKRKLIRSLGVLIGLVGDSMASYSPQVSWCTSTMPDDSR